MLTTFFGGESFGGDAVFVDRLSRALVARGHEVEVVHCADAYRAVRGRHRPRPYAPPEGVTVHTLESPFGRISPLWTHQTAGPGPKGPTLRRLVADGRFDVVHVHNVSLLGVRLLGQLRGLTRAVRLMTAHEHWLVCPTHHLWKLGRELCVEPECVRCTLHAHRPPQLWRRNGTIAHALETLDALIFPSANALELNRERGITAPAVALPYFVPQEWIAHGPLGPAPDRPYVAAAGRFVTAKGFHRLVAAMPEVPDLDLRLAGGGPAESQLRGLARRLPNVRFEGWLPETRLASLFRLARAVVVPSLSPETFGYVGAEALAMGRPIVVNDVGATAPLTRGSGGGIVYGSDGELVSALRLLAGNPQLADTLGALGAAYVARELSEAAHVERYLGLIDSVRTRRGRDPLAVGA